MYTVMLRWTSLDLTFLIFPDNLLPPMSTKINFWLTPAPPKMVAIIYEWPLNGVVGDWYDRNYIKQIPLCVCHYSVVDWTIYSTVLYSNACIILFYIVLYCALLYRTELYSYCNCTGLDCTVQCTLITVSIGPQLLCCTNICAGNVTIKISQFARI